MCESSNLEIFMENLRPEALMSIGRHWSLHSGCLPMEEARTEGSKRIPLLLLTELFPFKHGFFCFQFISSLAYILGVSSHAITKPRELTVDDIGGIPKLHWIQIEQRFYWEWFIDSYITIHSKSWIPAKKTTLPIFRPPKFGKKWGISPNFSLLNLPAKILCVDALVSPFSRRTYLCFLGLRLLGWNVGRPQTVLGTILDQQKTQGKKRRCQWKRSILLKGDTSEKMACFSLSCRFWGVYFEKTIMTWWLVWCDETPNFAAHIPSMSLLQSLVVFGRDDDAAGIVFPDRFSQRVAPTFRRPPGHNMTGIFGDLSDV